MGLTYGTESTGFSGFLISWTRIRATRDKLSRQAYAACFATKHFFQVIVATFTARNEMTTIYLSQPVFKGNEFPETTHTAVDACLRVLGERYAVAAAFTFTWRLEQVQ